MSETTLSTQSHSGERLTTDVVTADELVLLLECDRPLAGSARYRLVGTDHVAIGRAASRRADRSGTRLDLRIPDGRVSAMHATIRREASACIITDERSKNGLIVNGRPVDRHLLRDGDIIECGRTFFLFRIGQARPLDEPLDVDGAELNRPPGLATFHEPLAEQFRALSAVASTSLPVLILGATGTGKELVARAVHSLSQRRGSFVGINCGALPDTLVEAELFGVRRGAFTGANEDKPGLLRASDNGTLFLDEFGDLPLRAQATFLRALQEREVLSVGASRAAPVDLRVVAATHHDLDELVQNDRFRADLLARLSGFIVRLSPLRERIEDLGLLISALLARHATSEVTVGVEAMRLLLRHDWPLNVRELEHRLRAALAMSATRIDATHLPPEVGAPATKTPRLQEAVRGGTAPKLSAEQVERREQLQSLLMQHRGNISAVARQMAKDRVQIRRWIRQLGISIDELEY